MNYRHFLFGILVYLSCGTFLMFAQSPSKIDSLENRLTTATPEEKAKIFNTLSELLRRDSRGLDYGHEALKVSRAAGDPIQEALALKNIGIAQGYRNQYQLALQSLRESAELAEKVKSYSLAAEAFINVGTVYYVINSNYDVALGHYLHALELYERAGDEKGIASALSGIGIAYTHEKKTAQALETLNRSLSIYERLNEEKEIPKIKVNIGAAYRESGNYEQAAVFLNAAIAGFEKTSNVRGKAHALFVLAEIHRVQKNYQLAIDHLTNALALNRQSNHKNSIIDCMLQLGITYEDMGKLTEARTNFLEAITIASELNKKESLSIAYQHLARLAAADKQFDRAYQYLNLHKVYNDSIFNAEKSKQIEEMQTRFETNRKEQEIEMLKQEKSLNNIQLLVAVGTLVALSVISFLVINRQKIKLQSERELAEKENQISEERKTLLEAELRNKELSEQQLQDQLQFKNKELASYTLNLIQKNEILDNLKQSVEEIKNSPDAQIRQKLQGLVNMVNYSFQLDRDWENFKMHFEQVHQDFFKKLLQRYPDLTANDLKLCSLIMLNLDNRGIAAILNISQESAKVARHRLRKKLDLPADVTLLAFFNSLESTPGVITDQAPSYS